MLLHAVQLATGHRPQLTGNVAVARGKRLDRAALDDDDFGIGDGFGGERMLAANLVTEEVARQIELTDLAPAVVQDLGGADGAADELVEIFGRFILPVDLRIADEGHRGAHHVEGIGQTVGGCRRREPDVPAEVLGAGEVGGVRQHG